MKVTLKILCIVFAGFVLGSFSMQSISAKTDGNTPPLWSRIVRLIERFIDDHDQDPYAHPGKGGLHLTDANGADIGVVIGVDSPEYLRIYDTSRGLIFGVNYWTGETGYPTYYGYRYFTNESCTRGDGEGPFFSAFFPEVVFRQAASNPRFYVNTSPPEKKIVQSYMTSGGHCWENRPPEEKSVVPKSALQEVILPTTFPAPLHLEVR